MFKPHPPTNFGTFGPILIKFGEEVEFSETNSIWEYGMPVVTIKPPQPRTLRLYPPRNNFVVIFHDEITFERFKLEG